MACFQKVIRSSEALQPFPDVIDQLTSRSGEIASWFDRQYLGHPPLFYNSVDMRHTGFKAAPVEVNIFSQGFNNLTFAEKHEAAEQMIRFMRREDIRGEKILLITESFTRNTRYWDNVSALKEILEQTGAEVMLGDIEATGTDIIEAHTSAGTVLKREPLTRSGNRIVTTASHFDADFVVCNLDYFYYPRHDMLAFFDDLDQPLLPALPNGLVGRGKIAFAKAYEKAAAEFGRTFDIDPWLMAACYDSAEHMNFKKSEGLEELACKTERLLEGIRRNYDTYGIDATPHVFIKANYGCYGMAVMTAYSGQDVLNLNKQKRKKMHMAHKGMVTSEVIIQEGLPTVDTIDGKTAEPVVYMAGGKPVGTFYRINGKRDGYDNLNAAGMEFGKLPMDSPETERRAQFIDIVARLAALSVKREVDASLSASPIAAAS